MKELIKVKTLLLLCTALIPCVCFAVDKLIPHKPIEYDKNDWRPTNSAWTKEQWTGDEKPFRELRKHIEAIAEAGEIEPLYIRYEKEALLKPKDALAQYAWAYSMFLTRNKVLAPKGKEFRLSEWSPVTTALEVVPSPKTYEFALVRFLVESLTFSPIEPADDFNDLAARFMQVEPKSQRIREYRLIYLGYLATLENQTVFRLWKRLILLSKSQKG